MFRLNATVACTTYPNISGLGVFLCRGSAVMSSVALLVAIVTLPISAGAMVMEGALVAFREGSDVLLDR